MKKYIVFRKSVKDCIHALQVDFLKLKASYPGKQIEFSRLKFSIFCEEFEIRYVPVVTSERAKSSITYDVTGVYGSWLLGDDMNWRYESLDNNEFLVWLREGDLVL